MGKMMAGMMGQMMSGIAAVQKLARTMNLAEFVVDAHSRDCGAS